MRRTILAFFALAVAGGCDPRDFDAALDKAPVQFVGAPGGFGSNAGRTLLPLAPPTNRPAVAAQLLFAGTDTPSLALAEFDGNGKTDVQTATDIELGALGLASDQGGISSAAWLIGQPAAGSGPLEIVALGMPGVPTPGPTGGVAFLNLVADSSGKVAFETAQVPRGGPLTESHFGLAVARGRVTQDAADEAIVVSDNKVHVLGFPTGDVVSASTCAVALPTPPDLYRSLAVARFLSDGAGYQQIAVGLPVKGGAGKVVILQYSTASGTAELVCASKPGLSVPGGNPPGFGTSLVAVPDVSGDGLADLVVGAPPDRAYLLFSPFDGSRQPLLITNADAGSEFGQRVALVGTIDSKGVQKIAITALQADVGSTKKAGQVFVYELAYLDDPSSRVAVGSQLVATVNDGNPTAKTEFFGIGLADLEFNSSGACAKGMDAHLLVAGADAGIFTFFRFPGSGPDPRCFVQK